MNDPVLKIEKDDGIAVVTLNRPDKLNSLSRELRRAIVDGFRALEADGDVDVVILTGTGRAFCAGLDLKELGGETGSGDAKERENAVAGADVVSAVSGFPGPVIGAINGFAITGGFELALACDVLVASEDARFADTHARVGILPGWGLSQKLSRLIGIHRAKEVSLSGNFVSAAEAASWGLVNRVVPADQLLPAARKLALDMKSCPRDVLRAYKKLIDDGFATTMADGLAIESRRSLEHMRGVSAADISSRREQVQSRGRSQGN